MAERRLLAVKDAFAGRDGVDVMPKVPSDSLPGTRFEVVLRAPGGAEQRVMASAVVSHVRGPLPPLAMLRLAGVSVEAVVAGTEIWVEERS